MAALVSPPPPRGLDASRRSPLLRGYSYPSPRSSPVQPPIPSMPKRSTYLEDGNWALPQPYNGIGGQYLQAYSESPGYDASMNTMALALGAHNSTWTASAQSSDPNFVAGYNDLYGSYPGGLSQPRENVAAWSGEVAAGQLSYSSASIEQVFPCSTAVDPSYSFPYSVSAFPLSSSTPVSAATVFSEQSILLEDARLNNVDSQANHTIVASLSPASLETQQHATFAPEAMKSRQGSKTPARPLTQSPVPPSKKPRSKPAKKNQNMKVRSSNVKYNGGKVVGFVHVFEPEEKLKRPRTKEQRERTAVVRREGACLQHAETHKGCDPSWLPYIQCLTAKLPVFKSQIDNIKTFRARPAVGHPLESHRTELFDLLDVHGTMQGVVPVTLTQDLGHELVVYVTCYLPRPGDKLNHVWYEAGEKRQIEMAPYCLTLLEYVRANVYQYINVASQRYLENIIKHSGPIVQAMLLQAWQFSCSSESTMVKDALNLLALNRMIERDWRISGPETLGLPLVDNVNCPWFGKVPVTPMMDTGLDQVVIKDVLMPLRRKVLSELHQKMHGKKKQDCFEIILTVFIMATNTEWLLRHSRGNAIRYNVQNRYSSMALAQEYFHGHNTLLSHFHHLTRGSTTSSRVQSSLVVVPSGSSLSSDQSNFLQHIQALVMSQVSYARQLRAEKRYEAELHWSHQIFLQDWEPIPEIVHNILVSV